MEDHADTIERMRESYAAALRLRRMAREDESVRAGFTRLAQRHVSKCRELAGLICGGTGGNLSRVQG